MQHNDQSPSHLTDTVAQDSRRAWVEPQIERMKAGDAENGIDPIIPDVGFTFGS